MAITAYELARDGHPDYFIAASIGVDKGIFSLWTVREPLLAEALARGRKFHSERSSSNHLTSASFVEYVYKRLPEELRELWDKIALCQDAPNGNLKIEALFKDKGERARQHLWMHAMISCNFNESMAGRMVNVPASRVKKWVLEDPNFIELLEELKAHKGNFFESALVKKVEEGDAHAVIFANRTFNKNRGYGESKEIHHSGEVTHTHSHAHLVLDPEELGLPLEVVEVVMKALEQKGYRKQESDLPPPLPVSVKEDEDMVYQRSEC